MQLDYDFTLLLLVAMRMTGCIMFNPIFGRRNIPMSVKIGLTLLLSLFVYGLLPQGMTVEINSILMFCVYMIKELAVGFAIGFIINLFLSTLITAGEFMDMQIGLSMSQIYDPGSNVNMPISASILNVMLMMVFFLSNSHITLMRVFVYAGQALPYNELAISPQLFEQLALMLSNILIYAVKMSMPVLAAEIVAEIGVGLIMKAVPQINVFVVNIQLKIIIGFILFVVLIPQFSSFFERLLTLMFDQLNNLLGALT